MEQLLLVSTSFELIVKSALQLSLMVKPAAASSAIVVYAFGAAVASQPVAANFSSEPLRVGGSLSRPLTIITGLAGETLCWQASVTTYVRFLYHPQSSSFLSSVNVTSTVLQSGPYNALISTSLLIGVKSPSAKHTSWSFLLAGHGSFNTGFSTVTTTSLLFGGHAFPVTVKV